MYVLQNRKIPLYMKNFLVVKPRIPVTSRVKRIRMSVESSAEFVKGLKVKQCVGISPYAPIGAVKLAGELAKGGIRCRAPDRGSCDVPPLTCMACIPTD